MYWWNESIGTCLNLFCKSRRNKQFVLISISYRPFIRQTKNPNKRSCYVKKGNLRASFTRTFRTRRHRCHCRRCRRAPTFLRIKFMYGNIRVSITHVEYQDQQLEALLWRHFVGKCILACTVEALRWKYRVRATLFPTPRSLLPLATLPNTRKHSSSRHDFFRRA